MKIKKLIPQSIKNIYHLLQAILANLIYGFPSRKIKVIGVTGTNGKTTTCQMITKILEESNTRVAMASTINFKLAEKEWVNATKFTTLSAFSVQKFIRDAVRANCEYLILETSSHSLDQFRTWGIKYDTAVITNVTREHLDYHKTMDEYRKAKLKLFKNVRNAVVNLNMEKPEDFLECGAENIFGYTTGSQKSKVKIQNYKSKAEIIQAENIELGIDSTSYKLPASSADGEAESYKLNLPGLFNLENFLAAICVGMAQKVSAENFKKACISLKNVPGRMEKVPNDKNLEIIIDYAVTPDSLEKVYDLISKSKKEGSKIISVLGACGERDRGKRPIMGEIVSRFADYIILTNEDPYHEDPEKIVDEIQVGIKNKDKGKTMLRIMDRRLAIRKALELSSPYDIIVMTGKGAEEIMAIGNERIPWNEKQVILEELEKI